MYHLTTAICPMLYHTSAMVSDEAREMHVESS